MGATATQRAKERPKTVTAVLSVVGYALVVGALTLGNPLGVTIPESQVNLLSHAIAAVNTVATVLLVLGWRAIRRDDVDTHRKLMVSAFGLILVFLVMYLAKTGFGGTKEIALDPGVVYYAYLAMLAVHILLSAVSVPVVLYALVLGLTHTPAELRETAHAKVGRVAAASWVLSLSMGVLTYLLLNHVYGYEFVPA
jgi:putative membrane protein